MPSQHVRSVRNYVSKLEKIVSGAEIYPRNANRVAFDSMALQTISKGFALARAVLLLIEKGFPDEAYGLSRSLVELCAGLRYITAIPDKQEERTKEFVYFDETEQNYWLGQVRAHISDPALLQEIESSQLAKELDAKKLDPKDAFRHWSSYERGFIPQVMKLDHPLDGTTNPLRQRNMAYAADYHGTSAYVHCSQRGLNNYFHDPAWVYGVDKRRSTRVDDTAPKAMFIVCEYLHSIMCYAFFGLNLDRPLEIGKLFGKVIVQFVK
jgi:Family of unknown function (DUF5677)